MTTQSQRHISSIPLGMAIAVPPRHLCCTHLVRLDSMSTDSCLHYHMTQFNQFLIEQMLLSLLNHLVEPITVPSNNQCCYSQFHSSSQGVILSH